LEKFYEILVTYDLGLRGNYEDLYRWLDELGAKECGDNCATFLSDKTREQIRAELSKFLGKKDRIYLINRINKGGKTFTNGKFIIGKRMKTPPWAGYSRVETEADEEDE
jgi:hypothetical protein